MATTQADDLTTRLRTALRDANQPLWLPELTSSLVDAGWKQLDCNVHLTRTSYGTARVLRRNPEEPRRLVAYVNASVCYPAFHDAIQVELLPKALARQYAGPGFRFLGAEEILLDGVCDRLEEALEVLARIPTLVPTICSLIRSLHLVSSDDNQVDVSFSDPGLPFSAFVSVPRPNAENLALRIGEALLHEAMHLQLTLVEAFLPLVNPTDRTYFSPWRKEYRTPQGVIHALYVFRVIYEFLRAVPLDRSASEFLQLHAGKRREEIVRQIEQLEDFHSCSSLTEEGNALVSRLLG